MAANKLVRFGPAFISNAAANILNPPSVSGGVGLSGTNAATYLVIKHVRLVNKTGGAVTATLYIGTTGGSTSGTEAIAAGLSVPANSYVDWYGALRLDVADFLTGVASAANSITIEGEGEIGVV